ncbi:MAG: PAS domain S-box protein [Desulfovibrio sp.]|nr:PAS domain S-box protein [Desulfovibrio sp.]MBI4961429.1 PAS domain S-box protein [Desulfovibrio sp.]
MIEAIQPFVNIQDMATGSVENHLAALLEAAVDAIVIMGADRRVKVFSNAAERLFGYAAHEVVGQNVNMLMPEPYHSNHDRYVKRHIDTGEKHIIGIGREVVAKRKDGSVFPAYLSVGEGTSEEGLFFVGILHDLSREKDTFRRVRELAAIVDSTGDAVIGKTLDGVVTYWNSGAEELYGYTAAEAIGRHVAELIVPAEKHDELEQIHQGILRGQGVARIDTVRQSKSGQRLMVSLTISPILDADGKVIGASAIARDITSRRMAEKAQAEARHAAEESNRIKTDFLSIVSHELRTPLTIILGNVSLLTDHQNMPDPTEAAEIAQDIEESANRLLSLINDLLDISDMEAGQAKLRLTPVRADDLVQEVVQTAESFAASKDIVVTSYSEPLELMADPLRLKQALLNLVDNAVKFTDAGTITIGVEKTGNNALFAVSDTGEGISDDGISRIFDAFHQADTSSTRKAQGTGLGLTIVKRIVELHGGVLNVESEPGKGSTFYIALPLTPRDTREDSETDA